jgi:uncharacterized protein (TIGR03437 family)
LYFCLTAVDSRAQGLTVLDSFNFGNNGSPGPSALIQGTDGNLYGTTFDGGNISTAFPKGAGTVFKVNLLGAMTTLYTLGAASTDGANPTGLIQAADGNFYGTTESGGSANLGTVFKITPQGALTTLHAFAGNDGTNPLSQVTQAPDGNFYGTTNLGGANQGGTIYQMTPQGSVTTLFSFPASTAGWSPSNLIQATDGNFYGTSLAGGTSNCGTVFEITPSGAFTILHNFSPGIAYQPRAGLIQATDGNFYGTTSGATGGDYGSVFKMTPAGVVTPLYLFALMYAGAVPLGGVIQGNDGNLYGTTFTTEPGGGGTLFMLTLTGTFTVVFGFNPGTIASPSTTLLQASDGNLYGAALYGGAYGDGAIFRYSFGSNASPVLPEIWGMAANAASYQRGIVSNSIITIFGTTLSTVTDTWDNFIVNGQLPTSVDGVTVMVGGQPAYPSFISPTQINVVAPNLPPGPVQVTVTNPVGASQAVMNEVQAAVPGFFQWPGGYAVATRQDFSLAVKNGTFPGTTTVPAKPGDVIILWGTGFGATSPLAPVGAVVPSDTVYNTADPVTVTIGTTSATVYGAALAPGYSGLFQVAIQIPAGLADGDYTVLATVAGVQSPSTSITVQQ